MSELHRKKITSSSRGSGFPADLPESAEVEHITEREGTSPVYVYFTVPDATGDTQPTGEEQQPDQSANEAICPSCGDQSVRSETRADAFDPESTYTVLTCRSCPWDNE